VALGDLIYLCPFCGYDPLMDEGVRLRCRGCDRTYEEVTGGAEIRVEHPSEDVVEIGADELAARMEEVRLGETDGGQESGAAAEEDPPFQSRATVRVASGEAPIRRGKEIVGFFEKRGPPSSGTLRLGGGRVRFEADAGEELEWPLLEIRALQGASSSLQISPREGGVVTFRFESESPRRWEELLKRNLRRAWSRAGRGEIVEFQPRIRVR
jgi:hypothetical protein